MHGPEVRERILRLASEQMNDCAIARSVGVPRSTVREIRHRGTEAAGDRSLANAPPCPRCWQPARPIQFSDRDYADLLGLYLGDGHIVAAGRTFRLRIFLDSKYPVIVDDCEALLRRCFPSNEPGRQLAHGGTMTVVSLYSTHLPCLFPQHGPGRKHDRNVGLEVWQAEIVKTEAWALLRGLIRSDGCSFVNRTGKYEYLSFAFSNKSTEIARLFERACEIAGVSFRSNLNKKRDLWEVRINQRDSVALMCQHVGVKR